MLVLPVLSLAPGLSGALHISPRLARPVPARVARSPSPYACAPSPAPGDDSGVAVCDKPEPEEAGGERVDFRACQMVEEASKRGDWKASLELLEAARAEYNGGFLARCLHAATVACSRAGQWETAIELLTEQEGTKFPPRIEVYHAAVRAAVRARKPTVAVKLLEQMRIAGTPPDARSYGFALAALRDAGDVPGCVALLQSMLDRGVPRSTGHYSVAVSACKKAGQGKLAARLLKDAQAAGLVPTEEDFVATMAACVAEGTASEGTATWNRLRALAAEGAAPALSVKAYTAAMALKAMVGNTRGARETLEMMEEAGLAPDLVAFNTALRACAKSKDMPAAEALLARLRRVGLAPDSYTYSAAISACVRNLPRALELLAEAEAEAGEKLAPAVYGAALSACARAGAGREALSLLERMRLRGVAADLGCCGAAVHALQAAGEWREVYDLLYSMRAEGMLSPDNMRQSHVGLFHRAKKELGMVSLPKTA